MHSSLLLPIITESHYTIDSNKILGKGNYGTVYAGNYNAKTIAIKRSREDSKSIKSLKEEIEMLKTLTYCINENPDQHREGSKYLIQCYGYRLWTHSTQHINQYDLLLEYADQGTLTNWIESGKFTWTSAYPLIKHMTIALNMLHSMKIIHSDVKPDNVLVCTLDDGSLAAKLTDFGLAQITQKDKSKMRHQGSPYYMAPEILSKTHPSSEQGDIYALGMITCVMENQAKPYTSYHFTKLDGLIQHVVVEKKRDVISKDAPKKIVCITNWCWQHSMFARPTASQLSSELNTPIEEISPALSIHETYSPQQ